MDLLQEVNLLLAFYPYKKWRKEQNNNPHDSICVSETEMRRGWLDVQKEQTEEDSIVTSLLFSVGMHN